MTRHTLKELKTQAKPYQPLAWTATVLLLMAAGLQAHFTDEMYGVYGFCTASILWTLVGVLWKEKSLIFLNGSLTIIYVYGISKHLYSLVG